MKTNKLAIGILIGIAGTLTSTKTIKVLNDRKKEKLYSTEEIEDEYRD